MIRAALATARTGIARLPGLFAGATFRRAAEEAGFTTRAFTAGRALFTAFLTTTFLVTTFFGAVFLDLATAVLLTGTATFFAFVRVGFLAFGVAVILPGRCGFFEEAFFPFLA